MPKQPTKKKKETPLMQQFERIKAEHPDAILLFRVGDFYETFGPDAITASRILGIVLTKRANGSASHVELAGFPHHSLDTYLPKLVRAGHRVAICDQLEDPKLTKTIVKRGVTEVVTPGVNFSDHVIDGKNNNYLASVVGGNGLFGMAFLDVTTGEFYVGEGDMATMEKFHEGHAPSELLYPRENGETFIAQLCQRQYSFGLEDWVFNPEHAHKSLLRHFGTTSLKGFGIADLAWGQQAAAAILHYLQQTRHERATHIDRIARLQVDSHVWLDRFTIRNLELVAPVNPGSRTLLDVLDECRTAMGSRALRRWLLFPLLDLEAIRSRHDRVQILHDDRASHASLSERIDQVGDLERLAGRAAVGRINPRELLQLGRALEHAQALTVALSERNDELAFSFRSLKVPVSIAQRIAGSIEPESPVNVTKGGVLRSGISSELDELRHVSSHAKDLLLELQQREIERTGISSLKVGYNNVFGYYLEVRNTHKSKVPAEWVRKQTLVSAERYVTEELKVLEERIMGAEERIAELEASLYQEVVEAVCKEVGSIQRTAAVLAELDVLCALAEVARSAGYCRPAMNDGHALEIIEGRHPVIEDQLPPGEQYVANDVSLDPEEQQILIITGPNMSGKSALLRQTALIVLMAQMGSFVPARSASIGVFDRVFTRVGASDNLSTGESTFMVEMNETASILNNLSSRSLLLLDEIGRGTSTYDGISIAWAITEFLHEHQARPRTLFATHYHELNEMAATFSRVRNGNVAVREVDGKVIFLRKLVPGGSDRSFGIHVAQMAGMPRQVVKRAEKVLAHLEQTHGGDLGSEVSQQARDSDLQLSFFQLDDPILERLRDDIEELDIDTLTPVEALLKLNEIKRTIGAGKVRLRKA